MAIPISYNIRNLKLRKGLTIMTALGIALTVTTAVFLMALLAGLKKAFMASGDPVNVLVMRKGSVAELSGGFDANLFPTLKTLPGIAKDGQGEPLASGEWVVVVVLPRKDGTGEVNVSVRGLMSLILAAPLMIRNSGATSIRSPPISTAREPLRPLTCEPPTRLRPMR